MRKQVIGELARLSILLRSTHIFFPSYLYSRQRKTKREIERERRRQSCSFDKLVSLRDNKILFTNNKQFIFAYLLLKHPIVPRHADFPGEGKSVCVGTFKWGGGELKL